jgi:hypothetical protein
MRTTSLLKQAAGTLGSSDTGSSRVERSVYEDKCSQLYAAQRNYEAVSRTLSARQQELEQVRETQYERP